MCGRYEGFDQRVHDHLADDEVSIGRYVLAGGELAAMVLADAVIRKLPGALGHGDSAVEESFSAALDGAPEYPHFTRPPSYRGWEVPEVLLSGDHERVREWRVGPQPRARRAARLARRRLVALWPRPLPFRNRAGRIPLCAVFSGRFPTPSMSTIIDSIERSQLKEGLPSFAPGDRVRVHFQVVEGNRRRTQVFEGVVLKRQGSGRARPSRFASSPSGSASSGPFPCTRPKIERLEVAGRGAVRRAKLYYLRGRVGKAARVAERRWGIDEEVIAAPSGGESEALDSEGVGQDEVVPVEEPEARRRGRGRGERP